MLPKIKSRLKTLISRDIGSNNTGFTMIELIMIMTIIGALASVILVNFPAATKRARDTQRKSDLEQYSVALERFANRNGGFYPIYASVDPTLDPFCVTSLGHATGTCAKDPKAGTNNCSGGSCTYRYLSNTSGTQYLMHARLENPANSTYPVYVNCSNGRAGQVSTEPSTHACPATLY